MKCATCFSRFTAVYILGVNVKAWLFVNSARGYAPTNFLIMTHHDPGKLGAQNVTEHALSLEPWPTGFHLFHHSQFAPALSVEKTAMTAQKYSFARSLRPSTTTTLAALSQLLQSSIYCVTTPCTPFTCSLRTILTHFRFTAKAQQLWGDRNSLSGSLSFPYKTKKLEYQAQKLKEAVEVRPITLCLALNSMCMQFHSNVAHLRINSLGG